MADIDSRFASRLTLWLASLSLDETGLADLGPASSKLLHLDSAKDGRTEKLLRVQEAWNAALGLWRDEQDAFDFLTRKHLLLDNHTPALVAAESRAGLQSVRGIIERFRFGSAA